MVMIYVGLSTVEIGNLKLENLFQSSAWIKIKTLHWAFQSALKGSLVRRRIYIGWSSLSSVSSLSFFSGFVNTFLVEWEAEKVVIAKATTIKQSFWSFVSARLLLTRLTGERFWQEFWQVQCLVIAMAEYFKSLLFFFFQIGWLTC